MSLPVLHADLDALYRMALFVDDFTTDAAAGSVNGTLSSDGRAKRVVTDTGNDLSVSGGSAVFAGGSGAGDPGLWYTTTGDAAFTVSAGYALLVTWKPTEADKVYNFGFDSGTAGQPDTPRIITAVGAGDGLIQLEDADGAKTVGSMTNGTEKTHLFVQRSDTHGFHVLEHVSGKQWKRLYVDTSAEIGSGSVYPMFAATNGACAVSRIALLDLSSIMSADFSEVTDSGTNVTQATTFDCDADCQILKSWTYEAGQVTRLSWREQDATHYWQCSFDSTNISLQVNDGGSYDNLGSSAGVLSDGVAHEVDIVCEGSSCKVYLDKVLKISGTSSKFNNETGAMMLTNDLVSNDCDLTFRPYPALGGTVLGATDRVVCPQADDTGTGDADSYTVIRGIQVPSADNLQLQQRISGTDEVTYDVDSAGKPILYDNATARITGENGDVSSDDDVQVKLQGANGEVWHNGVSDGTTSAIAHATGRTWKVAALGTGGAADAIEFWPYYVYLPFGLP